MPTYTFPGVVPGQRTPYGPGSYPDFSPAPLPYPPSLLVILSGSGHFTAQGLVAGSATVKLAGSGSFVITGHLTGTSTEKILGSGSFAVHGSLAGTATVKLSGTGQVRASGSLLGSATPKMMGSGIFSSTGHLSATGLVRLSGTGGVASSGHLAGSATVRVPGVGSFGVTGLLLGSTGVKILGAGVTTAHGSLTASGKIILPGSGQFLGSGRLAGFFVGGMSGTGAFSAAGRLAVVGADISMGVLLPWRIVEVPARFDPWEGWTTQLALPEEALLPILGVSLSNTDPAVITTSIPHRLYKPPLLPRFVTISGVQGATFVNGTWPIMGIVSDTQFTIPVVNQTAYVSGGEALLLPASEPALPAVSGNTTQVIIFG